MIYTMEVQYLDEKSNKYETLVRKAFGDEEEAREFGNWFLDNSKCHVVVYMWVSSTVDYNDDSNRDIAMSRWSIDGDKF